MMTTEGNFHMFTVTVCSFVCIFYIFVSLKCWHGCMCTEFFYFLYMLEAVALAVQLIALRGGPGGAHVFQANIFSDKFSFVASSLSSLCAMSHIMACVCVCLLYRIFIYVTNIFVLDFCCINFSIYILCLLNTLWNIFEEILLAVYQQKSCHLHRIFVWSCNYAIMKDFDALQTKKLKIKCSIEWFFLKKY